jgi:MFS family permease
MTTGSQETGSATRAVTVAEKRRGYRLMAGLLVVTMLGGTLPVPLYVLYERSMGFGALGVAVVFAAYVIGTLFALVAFGDLSDHIGRKKVLAVGLGCAAISTAGFLVAAGIAPGIELLVAARIVSGLAAGFVTGTATAALAELQPGGNRQAAAVVASGANMTGLGLGPLIAGIFAAYVTLPTRSVFWLYLGLCALALAMLAAIPETVASQDKHVSMHPAMGVPPQMRAVVLGACLSGFAAFSVLGFFSSLVPTFLHGILGVGNLALIGGASFLVFIVAAISQAASARLPARRTMSIGLPLLLVCLAALESALFARTLWLFLAGTVIGGVAVGFVFRGGLSEINRLAEPRSRAAVVSTFFAAAYLGLGLPPVLTGLISLVAGTVNASAWTSGITGLIIAAAIVVVLRTFGTVQRPTPTDAHCDTWCCPAEHPRAVARHIVRRQDRTTG